MVGFDRRAARGGGEANAKTKTFSLTAGACCGIPESLVETATGATGTRQIARVTKIPRKATGRLDSSFGAWTERHRKSLDWNPNASIALDPCHLGANI